MIPQFGTVDIYSTTNPKPSDPTQSATFVAKDQSIAFDALPNWSTLYQTEKSNTSSGLSCQRNSTPKNLKCFNANNQTTITKSNYRFHLHHEDHPKCFQPAHIKILFSITTIHIPDFSYHFPWSSCRNMAHDDSRE
jgi:hypothetical protein